MFSSYPKLTKIICAWCIFVLVFTPVALYRPRAAQAQLNVPIGTDFDFHSIEDYLHTFVLKGLATSVARMILQQMTTSVVSWINSGFKGSPAFVTDPAGFFENVGDQLTGEFLQQYGGPLTNLCSPFSYDIRVSIALSQAQNSQTKYTCTLSSIITNTTNAAKNATLNGQSIAGFVKGDFSQGGWPAFVSMTTEPQNNVYGAYQQAQADLNAQIGLKQASVNVDLTRGDGFLSYQNCTDILSNVDPEDPVAMQNASLMLDGNTTANTVQNSDGSVTYQSCTTETPGSVISGALQKQLGAPVDQLNLTNDINQIFSALFATLVSSVLSGGLHSYSGGAAAQTFTNYVPNDLPGSSAFDQQKQALVSQLTPYAQNAQQYQNAYGQAVLVLQNTQEAYASAQQCISAKITQRTVNPANIQTANADIGKINAALSALGTALADDQQKLSDADSIAAAINTTVTTAQNVQTFDDINTASTDLQSQQLIQPADVQSAQSDLTAAQQMQADAATYQSACTTL